MVTRMGARASAEQRLSEFAPPPTPFGAYVETVKIGNLLFLSGMLPVAGQEPQYVERVGGALSAEDGRKAAEIACLTALSAAKAYLASLDNITGVAKLGVYIATEGDFGQKSPTGFGVVPLTKMYERGAPIDSIPRSTLNGLLLRQTFRRFHEAGGCTRRNSGLV
jgi:enamine deaminase RidA (YjgF/YER057c/UK114 family)